MTFDDVIKYCPNCDEEYSVPEDMEDCPICEEELEEDL